MELSAQRSGWGGVGGDLVVVAAAGDFGLLSALPVSSLTPEVADAGVLMWVEACGVFSICEAGEGPVCVAARLMGGAV